MSVPPISSDSGSGRIPNTSAEDAALAQVLERSQEVQAKVEASAEGLAEVNAKLEEGLSAIETAAEQMPETLQEAREIEATVAECAQELHEVNEKLAEEIEARRKLEEELTATQAAIEDSQAMVNLDSLTRLPDRPFFLQRLSEWLARPSPGAWDLVVLYVDIDEFKAINDAHGNDVGDAVLQVVAERLQKSIPGRETVSRLGGDQFACMLKDVGTEARAGSIAWKLIDILSAPLKTETLTLVVRPSLGIATAPRDGRMPDELLRHAEAAMRWAKKSRTGHAFFHQVSA